MVCGYHTGGQLAERMSRLSAARLHLVLIQLAGRGRTSKLASRIGRSAKTVEGSRWRCISLRVWLVRGHRAFSIPNEACSAADPSLLPISTKTHGCCTSGEGRSLTSAAGLSDCTRAELPLRSQMLSQRVWPQRFMVTVGLLAEQRRAEGLVGRGRGTVSGSQPGREQVPGPGP